MINSSSMLARDEVEPLGATCVSEYSGLFWNLDVSQKMSHDSSSPTLGAKTVAVSHLSLCELVFKH